MKNGFNLDDKEYNNIKNEFYFRGRTTQKLNNIEKKMDEYKENFSGLPCSKNSNRIKLGFLLIAILFMLLGYNNMPLLIKFFGF